jgi:uncharacterized membrane protein YkoI
VRSLRAMLVLTMSVLVLGAAAWAAGAAPKAGAEPAEPKTPKIKGTIKVEGKPPLAELKKKTKISQADAEKAAIKAVGGTEEKKVDDSELEIEQGFLIYSVDVRVAGKKGLEEVWIDAGSGKVLMQRHETDEDEDLEDEDAAGEDAGEDDSE